MKLFDNYFKFSIEESKVSNLEKYFDKKYSDCAGIGIHFDFDKNKIFYNKIKDFYIYYNHDAECKSFTERIYARQEFDFLKIITEGDLVTLKNPTDYSQPVTWKTFFNFCIENYSENDLTNLDHILKELSHKIENRKFDFKIYQNKYKTTKTNLLLNTFKLVLYKDIKNPETSIIREL